MKFCVEPGLSLAGLHVAVAWTTNFKGSFALRFAPQEMLWMSLEALRAILPVGLPSWRTVEAFLPFACLLCLQAN